MGVRSSASMGAQLVVEQHYSSNDGWCSKCWYWVVISKFAVNDTNRPGAVLVSWIQADIFSTFLPVVFGVERI